MLNIHGITTPLLPSTEPGPTDSDPLDFEEALDRDPAYRAFLFDLEQSDIEAEREQELEDEDEYQPPSFLWMGRRFPSPYTY